MNKPKAKAKSKHYQLCWNVFHAVDVVEQYEAQTGDKSGIECIEITNRDKEQSQ